MPQPSSPRHFLEIRDFTSAQLNSFLKLALDLKRERAANGNQPILRGQALGMIFQKPSLRTRVSFDVGMLHLGGHALYLSPAEIGLGARESIADIARVLNGYLQGIMARVFAAAHLTELARYSTIPVINGLSDHSHPCQTMADFLTIKEHFGAIEGLKIAWVGDSNNVTRSTAEAAALFGAKMSIASPTGYEFAQSDIDQIQSLGLTLETTTDPVDAVHDADVIMTDAWASMGQEAETEARRKVFPPYQVNDALLAHASPSCMVMHCLPAHREEEITNAVADGPHSLLFPQAHNRLHAQKAILAWSMGGIDLPS